MEREGIGPRSRCAPGTARNRAMGVFDQLLDLQDHDTTIDQLRHRRATLPERDRLVAARTKLAGIEADLASTQQQRDEVARAQKRLEDEVATVEAKVADV